MYRPLAVFQYLSGAARAIAVPWLVLVIAGAFSPLRLAAAEAPVAAAYFIGPDGRFDLDAARAAGIEGRPDTQGLSLRLAPDGSPRFELEGIQSHDDASWSDAFGPEGPNGRVHVRIAAPGHRGRAVCWPAASLRASHSRRTT
jgi:hypothetical protein